MVLEKHIKKKTFNRIIYILGAFLEVIGFGLLFAFDKTMSIISSYSIVFSLLLIVTGYFMAISVRKK